MQPIYVLLALTAAGVHASSHEKHDDWGYEGDKGPDYWPHINSAGSNQCGLQRQSPIDIDVSGVKYDSSLKPLKFTGDDKIAPNISVVNNGHSVQIRSTAWPQKLSGGPLKGEYKLLQIHFHWGKDFYRGSEHLVNGKRYPIEIHFVHSHSSNVSNKHDYPGALAVVGVFMEITKGNSNTGIQKVAKAIGNLSPDEARQLDSEFATGMMLPADRDYFTYEGSLTTPPCTQIVTWLVMKTPLKVTDSELDKFRSALFENGSKMVDNFRPAQPLNSRQVRSSFPVSSSGSLVPASLLIVLTMVALTIRMR